MSSDSSSVVKMPLFGTTSAYSAKPFLKWAGGKTQLLPQLRSRFPEPLRSGDELWPHRYFEPFMGGAATFFQLRPSLFPAKSYLSDTNRELVLTFLAVRDHLGELLERLSYHDFKHNQLHKTDPAAQRIYYQTVRAWDRQKAWGARVFGEPTRIVDHAARFIYLNKTCFNGLWRVNSKGYYNVPMGRYKNPGICNEDMLRKAHAALQGVHIEHQIYEDAVVSAQANDLVYFDPPYMPVSPTASFNAYAKTAFLERQHRELAVVFLLLASRKVHVVLSNADTPFTREPLGSREDFTAFAATVLPLTARLTAFDPPSAEELFRSYRTHWNVATVSAKRTINSNAQKRGAITEILVSTC